MQLFFLTKKPVSEKPASETRPHSLPLVITSILFSFSKEYLTMVKKQMCGVWALSFILWSQAGCLLMILTRKSYYSTSKEGLPSRNQNNKFQKTAKILYVAC